MSYPFNNRGYNCNSSMNNYNSQYNQNNNYGYGNNQMQQPSYGGGYSSQPAYSGMQMQMQPQQQQISGGGPRVNILPPGQALPENMKAIQLNWGDLLGGAVGGNGGQQNGGGHGLKVAMVGENGDMSQSTPGLRCTMNMNGQIPQNAIVMSINPYENVLGGNQGQR